jgi:two-component system phosphate regulon sensor histidine kinase PhoR
VWLHDLTCDRADHDKKPCPGTALAVPVASGGHTVAVMTLFADVVEDPEASLVQLLSGIAAHLGQFIERRRAEELQLALSRSKDDYLNLVGHELRTPLTVIASYLELMGDADPAAPASEIMPMVEAAQRASDRLRRLVEALLDLSQLDARNARMHMTPLDLAAVAEAATCDIASAAASKGIELTVDLPDEAPAVGDARRLRQLLTAVLDNAVTYTPPGGRVTFTLAQDDSGTSVRVADTGYGIPEAERAHVFERFYRGAIATEQSIPGAGLGLATAQLIAQRHHGRVVLTEDEGPGSTFVVHLPVADTPTA